MADENKPKVTGKRTIKYKQIAEELAKQNKEALANTRLGKRKQAERIAKQEAEEAARVKQQQAAQAQKAVQPQKPANNQPVANQNGLPVSEPRTIQEINEQDKPVQAAAPVQKKEPAKEPPVQKQSEVKTNTAKAVEQLKKVSEEPNKAEIKPDKDNADNSSDKKETLQKQPQNEPVNKERNRKGIVFAIAAAIFVLVLFIGGSALLNKNKNDVPEEPVEVIVEDNTPEPMPAELKNEWLTNKAINSDFVGSIKFDSGLVDLPFVQAKDVYDRNGKPYTFYTEEGQLAEDVEEYTGNDVYIWTNWKTGEYDRYDEGGSVFMDYRNNLADQNIIIYGHHFARDWDPSGSKQFTPLDALLEEENYEANKSFRLILDNEIREYVITNVFTINIENDYELNILRRNMNEDYSGNADPGFFNEFIRYIDGINRYPIDEKLNEGDSILTLVTCMQHQPELRQIIIAKETEKTVYK